LATKKLREFLVWGAAQPTGYGPWRAPGSIAAWRRANLLDGIQVSH